MAHKDGVAPSQNEPEGMYGHLGLRLEDQQHPARPTSSGARAQNWPPTQSSPYQDMSAQPIAALSNTGSRTVRTSHSDRSPHHSSTTVVDNQNICSGNQQQEQEELRARACTNEQREPSPPVHPYIFDEDFEAVRTRAGILKDQEKQRASIPEMISGFKAKPLTHSVPGKVIHAFKAFEYIPYTSLTTAACLKADNGEQEMELRVNGTLAVKKLDRQDERAIREGSWQAASKLAVELA
ncbi:hypothetical protein M422DRAFT_274138 [Sphaerobolus stellatus SS14]|uniref:Uncharacterized protein n=1 Tax=Sphaerobolus stellatus (strain SS14) TaxID=990650 RepID=A0A0C9T7J9_SPHS4|nr:hypothetical protein M422DRAFT_274138 [Sphaerobolus stellatus SS14]